jgi:hypothetical protein
MRGCVVSVHVGELTTQVEVSGLGGSGTSGGSGDGQQAKPPGWAERQRFAELAEDQECARARTAAGGFDG